jgi:hypothetical protein
VRRFEWKQEYTYLSSNERGQHDLRHLGALIQLLLPYAPHLFRAGLRAVDVIPDVFDSVPRAMRLCFLFDVPVVLMMAVCRLPHHKKEGSPTFHFVEACAAFWPHQKHRDAKGVTRKTDRTWCSWLAFLLELPELTAEQLARLVVALQEDGFPVPPVPPNDCHGSSFVLDFLSFNVKFETALMAALFLKIPLEVVASINPHAVWVPQPVRTRPLPAPALLPPPLAAAAEQAHNIDDAPSLPLPPAPSTPPPSPLADANQFPSHPPHDDHVVLSDAEDNEHEHPALEQQQQQQVASRLLDSPPPSKGLDERKQANEESVDRLEAAADAAAAAAAAGNVQDHSAAAAAANVEAPQADPMADIPSSVPLVSSAVTSSSSLAAPSSSVSRITRKRSSPSDSEGDAPSAIRRKLSSLSPSLSSSSSLLVLLSSDTSPAVKSGLALVQGGGASASSVAAIDDAAWCSSYLAATEASSRMLSHNAPPPSPSLPVVSHRNPFSKDFALSSLLVDTW